jgi:hypothetical protein
MGVAAMGRRKPKLVRDYNWSECESMDIWFTHARAGYAGVIRLGSALKDGFRAAWRAIRNREIPNHALFSVKVENQVFGGEATPKGMRTVSMDKYRTRKNTAVRVYRWRGFSDDVLRHTAAAQLMREIRIGIQNDVGYDWWGAISSPFRKWHRKADNPSKDFCSENVIEELERWGHRYRGDYYHPLALMRYMEARPSEFEDVTEQILTPPVR